jgi:hypothetical protein
MMFSHYLTSLFLLLLTTTAQLLRSPDVFWKAACRGAQLNGAMSFSSLLAERFPLPLSTPWDGDGTADFAKWGYLEGSRGQLCDFDGFWSMGPAFRALNIDPKAQINGGPNRCFTLSYGDSWKNNPDGSNWEVKD